MTLLVIGVTFAESFLDMMNCKQSLKDLGAVMYFRLYFAGIPMLLLYNFCTAIMRSSGNSRRGPGLKEGLRIFEEHGVRVIRIGLCASDNLSDPALAVGGANHPALGELAMGELTYRRICREADRLIADADVAGKTMTVFVPRGATSRAVGQKKRNILRLNEKYCKNHAINRIKILENSSIIGYNIIIDFS